MRILVVTTEPVSAAQLRAALPDDTDPQDAEVMVVAPALHRSALRFWMSDADDAIDRAERVRTESLRQLSADRVATTADIGEASTSGAIEDALKTFAADRIVVFTHPEGEQRYREDLDPEAVEARFRIPVTRAPAAAGG